MSPKQRQSFLLFARRSKHRAAQDLHDPILAHRVPSISQQLLHDRRGRLRLAQTEGRQGRHGDQLGLFLRFYLIEDILRLAEGDARAQLEDAGGEVVLGREGGWVKIVEDGLVLVLVEGGVDVDQLAFR